MFTWIHNLLHRRWIFSRLSRFISGELSQDARREVARALDDPAIYAEYRRQKDSAQQLRAELGGVGKPDRNTFQRSWQNVARTLEQKTPTYRLSVRAMDWRMRLTAAGLAAALLIPMGLNAGRASANSVPTQPVPKVAHHNGTATSEIMPETTPEATPGVTLTIHLLDANATPTAPSN